MTKKPQNGPICDLIEPRPSVKSLTRLARKHNLRITACRDKQLGSSFCSPSTITNVCPKKRKTERHNPMESIRQMRKEKSLPSPLRYSKGGKLDHAIWLPRGAMMQWKTWGKDFKNAHFRPAPLPIELTKELTTTNLSRCLSSSNYKQGFLTTLAA